MASSNGTIFINRKKLFDAKNTLDLWERELKSLDSGVVLKNTSNTMLKEKYQNGNFIFAYYKADREFQVEEYKNIEKIGITKENIFPKTIILPYLSRF